MSTKSLGSSDNSYSASDIVGAGLTAILPTNLYKAIDYNGNGSELITTLPATAYIGAVNSYIVRNGSVWWSVTSPSLLYGVATFYVKHQKGALKVNEDQIYVSPQDLIDAELTLTETIVKTVLKVVAIASITYALVKVTTGIVTAKINQPTKKDQNE